MGTTTITPAQLAAINTAIQNGASVGTVWSMLTADGDQYAASAAQVINSPLSFFGETARNAWSVAGVNPSDFNANFLAVAGDYQSKYLAQVSSQVDSNGNYILPNTTFIEGAYIQALMDFNLPPAAAIDGNVAILNQLYPENVPNWYQILGLDPSRIGPTSQLVYSNIDVNTAGNVFYGTSAATAESFLDTSISSSLEQNQAGATAAQAAAQLASAFGSSTIQVQDYGGITTLYDSNTGVYAAFDNSMSGMLYFQGQAYQINSGNFRFNSSTSKYEYLDKNNNWDVASNSFQSDSATSIQLGQDAAGQTTLTQVAFGGTSAHDAQADVGLASISVGSGVSASLDGSGNSVAAAGGSTVTIGGNGIDGLSSSQLDQVTFSGTGGVTNEMDNSFVVTHGNGFTFNSGTDDKSSLEGSGIVLNLNGTGSSTFIGDNGMTSGASSVLDQVHVNADGDFINELANSFVIALGNNFTLNTAANDTAGAVGSGVTLFINSSTDNAFIGGNGLSASGASVDTIGFAQGGTVTELANSNLNVDGANITVDGSASDALSIVGSNVDANFTDGDITFDSRSYGSVTGGGGNLIDVAPGDSSVFVSSNNNIVDGTTGDDIGSGFGGNTFEGSGYDLEIGPNVSEIISGSNISADVTGNNQFGTFDITGNHDFVSGEDLTVQVGQGLVADVQGLVDVVDATDGDTIWASNAVIDIAAGSAGDLDTVRIEGNNDRIMESGDDDVTAYGSSDIGYSSGSGDSFDDDTGAGVYGGPYGPYGPYGGGYGFAAKKPPSSSNIGAIAAFDLAHGDQAAAQTAQAARLQADAASTETSGQGLAAAAFEGPKWSEKAITWSLGVATGSGSPFTGELGTQYEPTVQQAFDTWATASGLNFEKVAAGPDAEIKIGFGDFDTADTGIAGYTELKAAQGQITGAAIMLEDPSETALSTDSNGQLAYAGTDTEFEQLVLHEIGHALGLADSSDPNSIMAATLTGANRDLDSTDTQAITALYGEGGASAVDPAATAAYWNGFSAQSASLIDAVAGFTSASTAPLAGSFMTPSALITPIQLAMAH